MVFAKGFCISEKDLGIVGASWKQNIGESGNGNVCSDQHGGNVRKPLCRDTNRKNRKEYRKARIGL